MKIPPVYSITSEMLEILSKIDALQFFFSSLKLSPKLTSKINRVSLLKSSLFSARIEGNSLTLQELDEKSTDREQIETANIIRANRHIDTLPKKSDLTTREILNIHKIVLNNLDEQAGLFRTDHGAIFNQAGVAVYMSPPPTEIPHLMNLFLNYSNSNAEKFPLILAFITHLIFEKIHPFVDGNGRVGRLLVKAILRKKRYAFSLWIPFEEYLESHKEEYYHHLDRGMSETNEYLLYMLGMFYKASLNLKKLVEAQLDKKNRAILPPRQEEILTIIQEHLYISFDAIKRRFLKVPERTLRYDLKRLADLNLITKIGKTKGVYYQAIHT